MTDVAHGSLVELPPGDVVQLEDELGAAVVEAIRGEHPTLTTGDAAGADALAHHAFHSISYTPMTLKIGIL